MNGNTRTWSPSHLICSGTVDNTKSLAGGDIKSPFIYQSRGWHATVFNSLGAPCALTSLSSCAKCPSWIAPQCHHFSKSYASISTQLSLTPPTPRYSYLLSDVTTLYHLAGQEPVVVCTDAWLSIGVWITMKNKSGNHGTHWLKTGYGDRRSLLPLSTQVSLHQSPETQSHCALDFGYHHHGCEH